jgi:hypothetical protein
MGVFPGGGEGAHIDQSLDSVMDEKLQELLPRAVGMSQGIDDNSHVPTIAQAGPNVDAASK